jgi:Protein of unknown function (DUF1320)
MPYPYVTDDQVRNRLGRDVCARLFDDNEDGVADTGVLLELRSDASSVVAGYLRGVYDLDAVAANTPREVIRLTLDVVKVYAAQRYPEVVRYEWEPLDKAARRDLESLRLEKTRLDTKGSPDPPTNVGARVGESLEGDQYRTAWSGRWGDF